MRCFKGLAGVWLGTGLSLTGATVVIGCGEDFDGCEASRTCNGAKAGKGGMSGADQGGAGAGGKAGSAGSSSGKGGTASGGKAGTASGEGGDAGDAGDGGAGAAIGSGGAAGRAPSAGTTGGGKGGGSGEAGSDSGPPVDATPHIVATSPANGEKGVLEDADITVTFSEPMNKETTRQAYSSEDLPEDKVTISWLDDMTLLIQPKDPLVYASVDSLEGDAKHYSFTIAGTATDLAGNALGDDRNYTFTTMRHISDSLMLGGKQYGRDLREPETVEVPCGADAAVLHAGDTDANEAMAFIAAFDLRVIPDGVLTWASARVRGSFSTSARNPFSRLGDLMAYNVVGELSSFAWDAEPVEDFGVAASYATMEAFNVNVLDAVEREYEHRDELPFSVIFRFDDPSDDDDSESFVRVRCNSLLLDFSITAP